MTDTERRKARYQEEVAHLAAEYLQTEAGPQSMVTVTRADASDDFHRVVIYFTVFPESAELGALSFAKRARSEFRDFVAQKMKSVRPPTFDFEIDQGDKNRLRVDQALS